MALLFSGQTLFILSNQPPKSELLCQALLLPMLGACPLTPNPLPLAGPGCDLGTFFPSYQALVSVPPVITHGALCPGQRHH